ncbi:MAG TPA: DUF1553 domain-containing protein, partial [Polyangiaceae bacterium]|nr:DUF1553 domain-containing protein [Polyangiaceae bacterium]
RASIDLVGRIPTADELRAFLADAAPDRRQKLVDRLLASPEHDMHLARAWEAILLGNETKNRVVDRGAFRRFLVERFAKNQPWDALVRDIVTAEGQTSVGGPGGAMAFVDDEDRGAEEKAASIDGATNYFLRFAKTPADLAGTTSKAFLGVQIQCAQCHDHKSEKWKQDDFRAFASALLHVQARPVSGDKGEIRVFEIHDAARVPRRLLKDEALAKIADTPPRALDGTPLGDGEEARPALAKWMTSKDNPYFARAMVNRVWAEMIGEGFFEPVDDMRTSNPPVMPEVLDALTAHFIETGFDLDDLYRTIASTRAYARSVAPAKGNLRDALFSRSALRPLSSDALLDSYFAATGMDDVLAEKVPARAEVIKAQIRRRLGFVFDDDSEANGDAGGGTMQQALFEMNGVLTAAATSFAEGSTLADVVRKGDDAAAVDELWLRTLSRHPTAEELAKAQAFLKSDAAADGAPPEKGNADARNAGKALKAAKKGKGGKSAKGGATTLPPAVTRSFAQDARERAYEDLFWALLNSSELYFRR